MATNIAFPLVAVNPQPGTKTVRLPFANTKNGCFFIVYDSDGSASIPANIIIQTTGGDVIDGVTSMITLQNPYDSISFLSNGISTWWIVSRGNRP